MKSWDLLWITSTDLEVGSPSFLPRPKCLPPGKISSKKTIFTITIFLKSVWLALETHPFFPNFVASIPRGLYDHFPGTHCRDSRWFTGPLKASREISKYALQGSRKHAAGIRGTTLWWPPKTTTRIIPGPWNKIAKICLRRLCGTLPPPRPRRKVSSSITGIHSITRTPSSFRRK